MRKAHPKVNCGEHHEIAGADINEVATDTPVEAKAKTLRGHDWFVEVKGFRKWTFPLVVVGANSIFVYSLEQVLRGWLDKAIGIFTFRFAWLGDFAPVAQSCAVLLVMCSAASLRSRTRPSSS